MTRITFSQIKDSVVTWSHNKDRCWSPRIYKGIHTVYAVSAVSYGDKPTVLDIIAAALQQWYLYVVIVIVIDVSPKNVRPQGRSGTQKKEKKKENGAE